MSWAMLYLWLRQQIRSTSQTNNWLAVSVANVSVEVLLVVSCQVDGVKS